MLFNSYEFLFAFLPVAVGGFLLAGMVSRSVALAWLIIASLVFYGVWRPFNLYILGASIATNLIFARILLPLAVEPRRQIARKLTLSLGILCNVAFLGYFKYANFAVTVVNDVTGAGLEFSEIILPLGMSFITFQKIAFLVDVSSGRIRSFTVRDFLLFVTYFPQLIAGPIVHYRESIPQFQKVTARFDAMLFSVGITLFLMGLFKKVVLADGISPYISSIYDFAGAGGTVTLLQAWLAAVGFTLQIYFDFSGYSDMACGASLLFGVRLPLNFDSPLKAKSIIDFWSRWHMTLTRFLTAYIYNPMVLSRMRRRAKRGLPPLSSRNSSLGAFVSVLAVPTFLTMLASGIWHGAAYTFFLWGLLHGAYLVVNHAWRQYGPSNQRGLVTRVAAVVGFAVTFSAVAASMVLFRAPTVNGAVEILAGMFGANGLGLPSTISAALKMPQIPPMMLGSGEVGSVLFLQTLAWTAGLATIALTTPNTAQILKQHDPVLFPPMRPVRFFGLGPRISWQPSILWAILIAGIAAFSIVRISGESEFLYWQF